MEDRIRAALAQRFDERVALDAQLHCLGGHASLRIYWRITLPAQTPHPAPTLVAMVMPLGQDAFKSEEGSSRQASPQELPFINVQRHLAAAGLPVPELVHEDGPRALLLLEDLGSRHFEDLYHEASPRGPQAVRALYQRAIDLLIQTQRALTTTPGLPPCLLHERGFDAALLRWELEHFREWGLHARHGGPSCTQAIDAALDASFGALVEALVGAPQAPVLRDYQSRNIMAPGDRLVLIDFQDALMGPAIYDLVALLRDSYIELAPPMVEALLEDYIQRGQAAGLPWCQDAAALTRQFYVQVVQRKLKDAGRFIFIDRVKGNPSFLPYYEPSLGYVDHALRQLGSPHDELIALIASVEPAWPRPGASLKA